MTLIDSNVLLDIVTLDDVWSGWSLAALEAAAREGPLLINDIVYAELSVRYAQAQDVDAFVQGIGLQMAGMPRAALFVAAKAFDRYRKSGGTRTGVLPDFFIGAHAVVAGIPLVTRDPKRYRTYFPDMRLITPD